MALTLSDPNIIRSIDSIKVLSVDAEPVENKTFAFTVHFHEKNTNARWRITHSFARFKVLELFIRKRASKTIYSKFPRDGNLSILGIRRRKDLENRRLMLDIWIREVVANTELLPEDIQMNIWDFMRVPPKVASSLGPRTPSLQSSTRSGHGNALRLENDVDSVESLSSTLGSSAEHINRAKKGGQAIRGFSRHTNRSAARWITTSKGGSSTPSSQLTLTTAPRKKSVIERMLRTIRKKLRGIVTKFLDVLLHLLVPSLPSSGEGIVAVCLGRNERMINGRTSTVESITSTSEHSFFIQLGIHALIYVAIVVGIWLLDLTVGHMVCHRYGWCTSFIGKIVGVNVVMYCYLLLGDYDRMDGETVIGQPSYLKVQEQLRVFLDAPNLEYTDEPCPFPMDELLSDGSEDEHDVWRDVGGQSEDTHGYSHNSNDISVCRYNNHNHSCLSSGENSPNALATAASGALSHGGSSSHHGPSKDVRAALAKDGSSRGIFGMKHKVKIAPQKLHETLIPGSTVDNCEWTDVSKEARAMYTCRASTHSLKVRGETYMEDQKKIAPGAAMSKLMLLELYEVEAKDGDRHDHVVSRGKAKQRLEALRTLPEHLFFIVFNIQLPGDPPISIVSYFAVPLDLMEKYPSRATAKFLDMFEKFVDAPRTERQRLAAWGVTVPPEEVDENNGEEEGEGEGGSQGENSTQPPTVGLTTNDSDATTHTAEIHTSSGTAAGRSSTGGLSGNGSSDRSSHHHPAAGSSSTTSSAASSGKMKDGAGGASSAGSGEEGKQLTNGSSHARGRGVPHLVSPITTGATAANSSGGLKSSLFTAITCSNYLSSPSPLHSRESTPEKSRHHDGHVASTSTNNGASTHSNSNTTTTQHPPPSNSHPLTKIGQAKKIVREAAALGGGGLRRLSHYVIGGGSHHDTNTATSPPDDTMSGNAASAAASAGARTRTRTRSNSDQGSSSPKPLANGSGGDASNANVISLTRTRSLYTSSNEYERQRRSSDGHDHPNNNHNSNNNNLSTQPQRGSSDKTRLKTRTITTGSYESRSHSPNDVQGKERVNDGGAGSGSGASSGSGSGLAGDGKATSLHHQSSAKTTAETMVVTGGGAGTKAHQANSNPSPGPASVGALSSLSPGASITSPTTPSATTTTTTPTAAAPVVAKSSSWIPQDITWPTAHDVGALPQSDYRNERFKLIPSITEGPWVVRAAVRATPAMLGKKVVQRYFRGDDYLEIDVHVGSSVIASNIVGICRGYAKQLINDCGIVLQGENTSELPERMLACVSLNRIDVNIRRNLDVL